MEIVGGLFISALLAFLIHHIIFAKVIFKVKGNDAFSKKVGDRIKVLIKEYKNGNELDKSIHKHIKYIVWLRRIGFISLILAFILFFLL